MKTFSATLFALLLTLAVAPVAAEDTPQVAPAAPEVFYGIPGLPFNLVTTEESLPGETMDQFVVRIAPALDAFTAKMEWEACGVIGQAPDGHYGIVVGSIQAALTCATSNANVLPGMVATNQSFHSHPRTATVRPTVIDRNIQARNKGHFLPFREVESNKNAMMFSEADYAMGPGYMLHNGTIRHQEGRGTTRVVGKLEHKAKVRFFDQR
jgi:hypothetical protein